jgi:hypothetical protein
LSASTARSPDAPTSSDLPRRRLASLIRLVSMLAIEANDEWLVGRSYISQKSMATLCDRVVDKEISPDNNDKEVEFIAA